MSPSLPPTTCYDTILNLPIEISRLLVDYCIWDGCSALNFGHFGSVALIRSRDCKEPDLQVPTFDKK